MTSRGTGCTVPATSRARPRVTPRFGFVSASMASTACPRRPRSRASVPATVVFPDPPLPATATFIGCWSPLSCGSLPEPRTGLARGLTLALRIATLVVTLAPEEGRELLAEAAPAFRDPLRADPIALVTIIRRRVHVAARHEPRQLGRELARRRDQEPAQILLGHGLAQPLAPQP